MTMTTKQGPAICLPDEKAEIMPIHDFPGNRRALTNTEFEQLKRCLSESPEPPSPEMREAVVAYKQLMAERIRK